MDNVTFPRTLVLVVVGAVLLILCVSFVGAVAGVWGMHG